jgi:uncharacterized protein YdeI (YjbR/CyaY-like superfamily)
MNSQTSPRFFASRARFRAWLEANHAKADTLWIGFWKASSGKKGLTYPEALDEALCFGWIDGLKKRLDDASFVQRFTQRRKGSYWSTINVRKVGELEKAGLMTAAGRTAFEARDKAGPPPYSAENRHVVLSGELEKRFRAKTGAWRFFEAQPPGYRRIASFWVMNAKRPETRERRLAQLIDESARKVRLGTVAG